jgi:hypothetical protein
MAQLPICGRAEPDEYAADRADAEDAVA